jgi:hypothetical protein
MLVTFTDINDPKTVKRVDPNDFDVSVSCPGAGGLSDADAPWRAQGKSWRKWYWEQSQILAGRRAGEAVGLNDHQTEALMKVKMSFGWNGYKPFGRYKKNRTRQEFKSLQAVYIADEKNAIAFENKCLKKQRVIFAGHISKIRDTSHDCNRLKSITLEITDEPVTNGVVEGVLAWLATVGNGMLDGEKISSITAESRLANDLSRLDFKQDN